MQFRPELAPLPQASAVAPGGIVVERPPPGLARGKYPASPWAIVALGGTLVLGTILYFVLRLRKLRS
jgi:hypothetical protein